MGNSQAKSSITPAQHEYLVNLFKYTRKVEKWQHTNKKSRSAALEIIVAVEQLSTAAAKKEHITELRLFARVVENWISVWQRRTFADGKTPKEFIWVPSADDIFK
jgi:hypothetical protein